MDSKSEPNLFVEINKKSFIFVAGQYDENLNFELLEKIVIDHKLIISNGYYDNIYGMCFEQADITYIREYYSVEGVRVTIDKDIKYNFVGLNKAFVLNEAYDDSYVLEIKADIKTSSTLLLNKFNFPRSRFSKYERAIESLIDR